MEHLGQNPWGPGVSNIQWSQPPHHQSSQNCSRLNSWFLKTNFTWPCVAGFFTKEVLHITMLCAIKVGSYLFDMHWSGFSHWLSCFSPFLFLHLFQEQISASRMMCNFQLAMFDSPARSTENLLPKLLLRQPQKHWGSEDNPIGVANQSTWVGRTSKINPVR